MRSAFLVFLFLFSFGALKALQSPDTTRLYTKNRELASVSVYKNGVLQFKKIYWQDLPNGQFLFVSKTGFVTVKNGSSVRFGPSTPDNVIEMGIDENNNVLTYIWKKGKKEVYEVPEPDGTRVMKYEGSKPGVYEWRGGKLKFIRKLNKEELEEKEKISRKSENRMSK
jgi:hypothetical protein